MDRAAATVSRRYRRRPAVTCDKDPSQVRQGLFGSYLDLNIQELGDFDRTVTLTARPATNEPDTPSNGYPGGVASSTEILYP